MARARNTEQKRSTSPKKSIFQSAPASVMIPRLCVILPALALAVIGLVMVYSASSISGISNSGDAASEAIKQIIFTAIGLVFCLAIIFLSKQAPDLLWGPGLVVYWALCVLGILATAAFGTNIYGAQRWIMVGNFSLQISEFAKIAFVLMAARIASQFNEGVIDSSGLIKQTLIFIVAPLVFLFIAQSDMGTTAICAIALLAVLWLAGFDTKALCIVIGLLIILGIVAIATQGYRSDRFIFLDPWSDADDKGYQLIRGFKAFAAGGLLGQGIGNSYEKMLYLPMSETDFVFAILGEEMGLVGTVFVVVLFIVMLYGSFRIASQANSQLEALMAAGLGTMLVFQAFLNIACVIGIAPTTGKPLPFISSGGSSLVSTYIIVGAILAVSFNSHSEDEYRQRRDNLRVVSTYAQGRPSSQGSGRRPERAGSTVRERDTFRSVGGSAQSGAARNHNGSAGGRGAFANRGGAYTQQRRR